MATNSYNASGITSWLKDVIRLTRGTDLLDLSDQKIAEGAILMQDANGKLCCILPPNDNGEYVLTFQNSKVKWEKITRV